MQSSILFHRLTTLHIIAKTLSIAKKIELIDKKRFVVVVLNLDTEIFVIYILALEIKTRVLMNPPTKIIILAKYLNYVNIFLPESMIKLFDI